MGSRLFDRLKGGLEEGIEHARGAASLRVTELAIPDPPPVYTAGDVQRVRARLNLSQAGFARLLQVSSRTIQSWEQGTRTPSPSSARLIQFIENPRLLSRVVQTGHGDEHLGA